MASGVGLIAIYAAMALATFIGGVTLVLAFTPYRLKIDKTARPLRLKIEKPVTPLRERWSTVNTTLLVTCGVVVTLRSLTDATELATSCKGQVAERPGQTRRRPGASVHASGKREWVRRCRELALARGGQSADGLGVCGKGCPG
jgi:hypothetical protein